MASSSPASSSRSSRSPEPPKAKVLKRKRKQEPGPEPDEDSDSDNSDAESDAEPIAEGPVLSHAEKRRQKRLENQANRNPEKSPKKQKLKDGSAAISPSSALPKRQHSVWVGNMSFKTTQDNLRSFFAGVGDITRINMPTKAVATPGSAPENRGFAYVDFETPEAKAKAIALSEKPLIGRKLLIKDGDDFAGRPIVPGIDVKTTDSALAQKTHTKSAQKILRVQKQPPAPTLFIGNLPYETKESDIRGLFDAHRVLKNKVKDEKVDEEGKEKPKDDWIRKIRMGTFEDSGACKGFAFVDFTSIDSATSALINPKNHHLNGRNLVVEYAGADAVRRGAVKDKSSQPVGGPHTRRPTAAGHKPFRKPHGDSQSAHTPRVENGSGVTEVVQSADYEAPTNIQKEHNPSNSEPNASTSKYVRGGRGGERDGIRQKGPRTRPKPGAALALAKRETAAIIPSQGKKITF